jgi:hypothetical protein
MLFGSVFMSMPLAIIGNEYADAWTSLKADKLVETIDSATDTLQQTLPLQVGEEKRTSEPKTLLRKMSSTEVKKESYSLAQQALLSPLIECRKNLDSSVANLGVLLRPAKKMNPAILLSMCELRGWIAPLLWNIRVAVRALHNPSKAEAAADGRKLSVFRSVMTGSDAANTPTNNSVAPLAGYARPNNAKPVSQGSNLGALRETPEEDDEKPNTIAPTLSNHNLSAIAPLPSKRGRAPTTHPNASGTDSHLSNVKKFLTTGTLKPPAAVTPGPPVGSGAPLGLSFWGWGTSSQPPVEPEAGPRVAPAPPPSLPMLEQNNNESDDEKSGEDSCAVIAPEPPEPVNKPPVRRSLPNSTGTGAELATQIKMNRINHAVASLTKQPSMRLTKQRSMESMTFLIKLAKAAPDIAKMRGDGTEFSRNMERAVKNPKALRTKLWMLMELPSSSKAARWIQMYLLFLIMVSVLMLYTQTLPSFTDYSESATLCGRVLKVYCADKNDMTLDPGCYAQSATGPTEVKLRYDCTHSDCFSHGLNFGSEWTNMTCDLSQRGAIRPFQTLQSLEYNIRRSDFTVPREKMHQIQDVCYRMECRYDSPHLVDGNSGWLPLEVLINLSFTIEIVLRVAVSFSWSSFFLDVMNLFDILSVIPFYLDIINGLQAHYLNFAIISSSPDAIILVTLKSLKVCLSLSCLSVSLSLTHSLHRSSVSLR